MPEPVTVYRCAICKTLHKTMMQAANCEALGPAPLWPKGMIFQLPDPTLTLVVFAIHNNDANGHNNRPGVWVARDDGGIDAPPITEYITCLPGQFTYQQHSPTIISPNQSLQAFIRMAGYLEEIGIKPTMWSGHSPVPLPVV
jgi:hypothetical protein